MADLIEREFGMNLRRLIGVFVMLTGVSQAAVAIRNLWTVNRAWKDPVSKFAGFEFWETVWTENVIWLVCSLVAIGVGAWWFRSGTMRGLGR